MKKILLLALFVGAAIAQPPWVPYGVPIRGPATTTVIDTADASGLIHDSLACFRDGTCDIDVNNARIRGTGDVDGQFRAGSLTGPDYALKVVPGDHEISTDQTIFVKIDGGMEVAKNGVGDYGVYIDTTMLQVAVTGDFLGNLNTHKVLTVGDAFDLGYNPVTINTSAATMGGGGNTAYGDSSDWLWTCGEFPGGAGKGVCALYAAMDSTGDVNSPLLKLQAAHSSPNIGELDLFGGFVGLSGYNGLSIDAPAGQVSINAADGIVLSSDATANLDFTVHGSLAVGPMDGGSSSIYIGGDNTYGDTLTGSFLWATALGAGTLNISAVQHQGGETTTNTIIALTPYAENAAIGTVRLDGEAVNVSSFSTGSTKFVCASSSGDLFTSATVCVGP